jgi:hypothetical protein
MMLVTAIVAALLTIHKGKESYTDPGSYVPWILIAAALVVTTMTVNAMSPVINVVIAAAILWYVYKVPTVKTMTQSAIQEITTMLPKPATAPAAPAPAPAAPAVATTAPAPVK